jgi:hypothetical protein
MKIKMFPTETARPNTENNEMLMPPLQHKPSEIRDTCFT